MPSHSKAQQDGSVPACYMDTHGVVTTTTDELPGYHVRHEPLLNNIPR